MKDLKYENKFKDLELAFLEVDYLEYEDSKIYHQTLEDLSQMIMEGTNQTENPKFFVYFNKNIKFGLSNVFIVNAGENNVDLKDVYLDMKFIDYILDTEEN